MALTPALHAKGFYGFKHPWAIVEGVSYECLAIRSFADIYKLGIDVYTTYYKRVGLVTGKDGFDFRAESALEPNIITLKGTDGSVLYVPDTYITKLPDVTLVPYSEVIIGISLGALPDEYNLDGIKKELSELVSARLNIKPELNVGVIPLLKNPTIDEHKLLEQTRLGKSPEMAKNIFVQLDELREQNRKLKETNNVLVEKLNKDGLVQVYTRQGNSP